MGILVLSMRNRAGNPSSRSPTRYTLAGLLLQTLLQMRDATLRNRMHPVEERRGRDRTNLPHRVPAETVMHVTEEPRLDPDDLPRQRRTQRHRARQVRGIDIDSGGGFDHANRLRPLEPIYKRAG